VGAFHIKKSQKIIRIQGATLSKLLEAFSFMALDIKKTRVLPQLHLAIFDKLIKKDV
jgi:hypothetical protein